MSGVAAGAAGDFALVIGVDRGAGHDNLLAHGADLVVDDLAELLADGPRPHRRVRREPPSRPDRAARIPLPDRPVAARRDASSDNDDLGLTETLFAVGNGYLGMRANPEEGRDAHSHGTYVNGFHETWTIQHAEEAFGFAKTGQTMVNVPDAKLMRLYVDDEPLLLSSADLDDYERSARLPRRHRSTREPRVAHAGRQAGAGRSHPHGLAWRTATSR